jgi:hypothetical protein
VFVIHWTDWKTTEKSENQCINSFGHTVSEVSHDKINDLKNSRSASVPFHVYLHSHIIDINHVTLSDTILRLAMNGFLDMASSVTLAVVGDDEYVNNATKVIRRLDDSRFLKVKVVRTSKNSKLGEYPTLYHMQQHASKLVSKKEQAYFVYMHTTFSSKKHSTSSKAQQKLRIWLQHCMISNHRFARHLLHHGYDTLGCNPSAVSETHIHSLLLYVSKLTINSMTVCVYI